MAVPQPDTFPHIVRRPGVVGGDATINGTGIAVWHLVVAARHTPMIGGLITDYPSLTAELIEETFAYYAANRAEVNKAIAQNHGVLIAEEQAIRAVHPIAVASGRG